MTIPINIDKLNELIKKQEFQYEKQIESLKQENKKLKAENEKLKKEINDFFIINDFLKMTDKYKQALEGIRGIVTGNYEILDPQAKQDIQRKINEVLNERNN